MVILGRMYRAAYKKKHVFGMFCICPNLPQIYLGHLINLPRTLISGLLTEKSTVFGPNIVAGPRVAPFRVCIFYLLFTKKNF